MCPQAVAETEHVARPLAQDAEEPPADVGASERAVMSADEEMHSGLAEPVQPTEVDVDEREPGAEVSQQGQHGSDLEEVELGDEDIAAAIAAAEMEAEAHAPAGDVEAIVQIEDGGVNGNTDAAGRDNSIEVGSRGGPVAKVGDGTLDAFLPQSAATGVLLSPPESGWEEVAHFVFAASA